MLIIRVITRIIDVSGMMIIIVVVDVLEDIAVTSAFIIVRFMTERLSRSIWG